MALFLKVIEWSDDTKDRIVYKYPFKNAGREVNHKSKLVVRESQEAIFVHKGQICDIFPAGTYDLNTDIFQLTGHDKRVDRIPRKATDFTGYD